MLMAVCLPMCVFTSCSNDDDAPSSSAPEFVDLGLSVKWATFNVGANQPYEYGNYYAWAETEPKTDYSFATYKYCNDGSSWQLTKYCDRSTCGYNGFTDNKTTLELADDAANANWGGNCRMPTKAEFEELLNTDNCSWMLCLPGNAEFNGVAGFKVQSKKVGYTDNFIFLPAGACRYDTDPASIGESCQYWSSTLCDDPELYPACAYSIICDQNSQRLYNSGSRSTGRPVRPVLPVM